MNWRLEHAAVCSRSALALLGFVASTFAMTQVYAVPITLPAGPIFAEFGTREQYSASNDLNNLNNPARAGVEGNWGTVLLKSISVGTVLAPTGSDIGGPVTPIFLDGQNAGQQILGIFYGVQNNPGGPPFTSTGGVLDLYFWEVNNQSVGTPFTASDLSKRGQGGSQSGGGGGKLSRLHVCAEHTGLQLPRPFQLHSWRGHDQLQQFEHNFYEQRIIHLQCLPERRYQYDRRMD